MGFIALGKNCVFQALRHYNNYIFEIFATSCDIITWTLQDEIKSFKKMYFICKKSGCPSLSQKA